MEQNVAHLWAKAQGHEAARDLQAAKEAYEAILRLDSGQAAAWLRLSAFEQGADRYRNSRLNVLKAAQAVRERKSWKNLAYVTMRLLALDERDAVRDLIVDADWSSREVLAQSAVLSQHLWLIGQYDAALRLIDQASRLAPSNHLLSYSRANALRYSGRLKEATDEYERCLGSMPDYAYAHWSLAYHQKSDPPGSRIDRIRKAKAASQDGSIERVHLCYALFKELDDLGDTEQAWPELQEGAIAMRHWLRHDSAQEGQRARALMRFADADFLRDEIAPSEGRTPIFVVGMPRTGTTLLERILSNHMQVATAGELNDFDRSMSWESDHFFNGAINEPSVDRFGKLDFHAVGRDYMIRTEALAGGRMHLVDKNPKNFFNAGFIGKALPQARMVCMVRNPMDACFSNLKELFTGDAYAYSYDQVELAEHYKAFRELANYWQETMPDRFRLVSYEDLVADPAGVSEHIAAFCGIAFDPHSVDITKNASPVSTASSSQVRQPIHSDNVRAWERYAAYLQPLREKLAQNGFA